MDGTSFHQRDVKAVLRRRDLCDSYFVGKYSYSPYQACAHGCSYCDGRAERYWVEGDFERDIVVRTNAPEVLKKELSRLREKGIVRLGSGVSDCYQPCEAEFNLTGRSARILAEHSMPVSLLTKSGLVLRDAPVWKEVHERAGFILMLSIQTLDEDVRREFEPRAAAVEERLQILAEFRRLGCVTGAVVMPILPGISDSAADLAAMAQRLSAIGVDVVMFGGLTLRPGRQKGFFFETLKRCRPDLVPLYTNLYSENRDSGAPVAAYSCELDRRARAVFREAGLDNLLPHRVYRGRLPRYDEVHVLLSHMAQLYRRAGKPVRRLEAAASLYDEWLLGEKKVFNRRRNLHQAYLESKLLFLAEDGGLADLLQNGKLALFLDHVLRGGKVFDYHRLELLERG